MTSQGTARFLFPVYSVDGENRFEGIELGPEMRRRLSGVYRLSAGPGGLPMDFRLAADWRERRMSQRLVGEERLRADDVGVGVFAPADQCGSRLPFIDATLASRLGISSGTLVFLDAARVQVGASEITVGGTVDERRPELARFHLVTLAQGDSLVARVHVARGGLAFGLLQDGRWAARVDVPRPGLNVIVVRVPASGTYDPVVRSAAPGWRPGLTFTLDRFGIVSADGAVRPLLASP